MHPSAKAAIGPGDDVLTPNSVRVRHDPVSDELGMLDDVRRMADDARDKNFSICEFHITPNLVFVLMADIGGFHRISLRLDAQQVVSRRVV